MGEAYELQCPNCGSNEYTQQAPALFRCRHCRSIYSPKFDVRGVNQAPPPPQPYPPPPPWPNQPGQQAPMHPVTALMSKDTATKYLLFGFISFFFCGAAAPVIWYLGYREAKRKGEDPGALLILSLVFGIPMLAFALLFAVMIVVQEAGR